MKKIALILAAVVALAVGVAKASAVGKHAAWTPTALLISCGEADANLPSAGTYNWTVKDEAGHLLESGTYTFGQVLALTAGWRALDGGYHTITFHVWYGTESGSTTSALTHNCGPGPAGPKGDTGATGATGPAGPQGTTGEKGEKGDKGDTGAPGAQGATGATGATGTAGPAGPAGQTGAQGVAGPAGAQGEKGTTGSKGDRGARGQKGDRGGKGERGQKGQKGASCKPKKPKPSTGIICKNGKNCGFAGQG